MSETNYEFELPDEVPGGGISSIRDQLADLDGVERAKIKTGVYGLALVGLPPADFILEIVVNTTNNSAYIVKFSRKNGWEEVEEVSPTRYWKQHTLATANE